MNNNQVSAYSSVYYRLVALWVLSEAMLGGIIHGLKLPVSGLVVGSCAVICICLIAWYTPKKGSIITATVIVAVFKMMLSPQAPLPAYIAVFFQGLLGELLFWNRRFYKLSCLLLAVLALLESGLQRILVLTIVYGNDIWKVINDFINGLTKQKVPANYSLIVGVVYVAIHFIAGLFTGWWAAVLPKRITGWSKADYLFTEIENASMSLPAPSKKKKKFRKGLFVVWILLILLYVQSYFKIGTPLLPAHVSLKILLRSLIIVFAWYFVAGPLLKQLLHSWLQKRKTESHEEVRQVLALLPGIRQMISKSWKLSSRTKGWRRIKEAGKIILVNALALRKPHNSNGVYLFTGAIQSGKTTSLIKWSANRSDVFGILSPVVEGKRVFKDAHTRKIFPMEAGPGDHQILSVGRFIFSKDSFDRAIQIIRDGSNQKGWLVIDEIGPLELEKKGFYSILTEILQHPRPDQKILLVVRKGLTDKIIDLIETDDVYMTENISNDPDFFR